MILQDAGPGKLNVVKTVKTLTGLGSHGRRADRVMN